MKRKDAVLQGAPLIHDLEEAAMDAVRAAAATTVGLIDLRREANLSATAGADAWEHLIVTTSALQQGLRSSIAFHREMTEVKTRMGCRTVATGGADKDDSDAMKEGFPWGAAAEPLRIVA